MITPSREADAKSTARGNWKAIITRSVKNPKQIAFIVKCVARLLKYELAKLCSNRCDSVLRSNNLDYIKKFEWSSLLVEAKQNTPHLMMVLTKCTETPTKRQNSNCIIGVIIAILAKHRRPQAALIQKLVSLLLYSGHCSKLVCHNE